MSIDQVIPAHVPLSRLFDFDHFYPSNADSDPHAALGSIQRMEALAPGMYTPVNELINRLVARGLELECRAVFRVGTDR